MERQAGDYSLRPDGDRRAACAHTCSESLGIWGVKSASRGKPRVGGGRSLDRRQGLKATLNMGLCVCLK